jgi:NADPH:quinone reductase-like Zn-dependent oxidoreductase
MKAIIYTHYGSPDNLRMTDVPKPTPKDDQVLVKVHAAAVNCGDDRALRGEPFIARVFAFGLFKPKNPILGSDIAGVIEAVGRNVTAFKVGDEVYGDLSNDGLGGFAEYVAAPARLLARKPAHLTFEEAATTPMAGVTALQALRDKGRLRAGEKVLIYGASGGVGTFAVQIAKALGGDVTTVTSTGKMGMMRELGADHVVDYTREDFATQGAQYDVILGVNGYRPIADYARALRPGGRYVMVGGSDAQIFEALLRGSLMSRGGKTLGSLVAKPNADDLRFLAGLIDAGKVKPIIERCYPLSETADAMRHLGAGHARGKVVIGVAV